MRKHLLAIAIAAAFAPDVTGGFGRVLKLADGDGPSRRVMSHAVELAEGVSRSWVTVTRTGSFTDPRYGRFDITSTMLSQMVRNFDAGVYGQEVFIDVDHKPGDGAAGKILALKVDNGRLRASVEWTEFGIAQVRGKGFRYLSAEFHEDFHDNEAGKAHGCTLLGAALTIRPVIKRLDPVTLAVAGDDDNSGPVFVHPGLVRQLTESLENLAMNRWLKFLAALKAAGKTLSDAQLAVLKAAFLNGAKALAEDADDTTFISDWVGVATQLADAGAGATVQLSVTNPITTAGTEDIAAEVTRILAERDTAAAQEVTSTATRREQFTTALAGATALSEATRTQLSEAATLINGNWTEDQVRALAEQQISIGERLESARQLSVLGFPAPAGTVVIATGGNNSSEIRTLSESIRVALAQTGPAQAGELRLCEETKLPPFVQRVLAQFDAENGHALHRELEARKLAGGPVSTGDMALPATVQREVIKEALSDLNLLPLIDAAVDPTTAATHTIPFETRDLTGVANDATVYEGQPISYAGVKQDSEYAYIEPTKLAINITNEAIHFSAGNPLINWDAYARTVASASRAVQEILHRRIANRLLRSSDSFAATAFTAAAATAGTITGNYKLAAGNWPLVRPRQIRDLRGNTVGAVQNPLVVNVAGAPIAAWNGTGTQSAGNYYLDNRQLYELGVVTVVTAAGVPVGSLTVTVSATRVTNVARVDLDVPGGTTYEKHLNKLLQAFGARKALLSQERYVQPNFALMAPTLADTIANAENFEASGSREDVAITSTGDLGRIKGIPTWGTNAPALDLGENRILLSQRGLLRYRISKAFTLGAPFEVVEPGTGRPVGKKQAYGEEFSTIHVPTPLTGYSTSILTYSATARTAL